MGKSVTLWESKRKFMLFLGEYELSIDAKGRFLFPTGFKKQFPFEEGSGIHFVMKRGIENCLTLIPMKKWRHIQQRISHLNDFEPKVREFKRKFLSGALEVTPDNAGRILIPKPLIAYARLKKEIVLCSNGDQLEIWDKTLYQSLYTQYSAEDMSVLAAQVMGTNDINTPL